MKLTSTSSSALVAIFYMPSLLRLSSLFLMTNLLLMTLSLRPLKLILHLTLFLIHHQASFKTASSTYWS